MGEVRVKVAEETLKEVVQNLRDEGYTHEKINNEIDAKIGSYIYNDYCMSKKTFRLLQELYGQDIRHKKKKIRTGGPHNQKSVIMPEKDEKLAEIIGLLLGDGHLEKHSKKTSERYEGTYYISFTYHSDERKLAKKTEKLVKEKLKMELDEQSKPGKTIRLVAYGKELVENLEELGLKSGNKKDKQVTVPKWILQEDRFCRTCLRGLIDTDGSIYSDKRKNKSYTRVAFKNSSANLLDDFRTMCSKIGIKTVDGGKNEVQISRPDVRKFIEKTEPLKARPHH